MPGPVASGDRAVRKTDTIATLGAHRSREGDTHAVMEAGHAPFPLGVTGASCPGWCLLEAGGLWRGPQRSSSCLQEVPQAGALLGGCVHK